MYFNQDLLQRLGNTVVCELVGSDPTSTVHNTYITEEEGSVIKSGDNNVVVM